MWRAACKVGGLYAYLRASYARRENIWAIPRNGTGRDSGGDTEREFWIEAQSGELGRRHRRSVAQGFHQAHKSEFESGQFSRHGG